MAEAAGLAVGAVALVSLFQTAVELLEYFEAARNLASDRELAATKVSLLEARLKQWGDDLQIEHPGQEDGGLRKRWEDEGGLVTKSLKGISELLGNASQLSEKYGLHKKKRIVWHLNIPSLHPTFHKADAPISSSQKSYNICPSIHRPAVWAIKDKKRFESLICDLDFLITNLEKVSGRLLKLEYFDCDNLGLIQSEHFSGPTMASNTNNFAVPSHPAQRQGYPPQPPPAPTSAYGCTTPSQILPPTSGSMAMVPISRARSSGMAQTPMAPLSMASPSRAPSAAPPPAPRSQETHHSYADVASSGHAFAPVGDIQSHSDRKHNYGRIRSTDYAFAPVGNADGEILVKLLAQHQKAFQHNGPVPQPSYGRHGQ